MHGGVAILPVTAFSFPLPTDIYKYRVCTVTTSLKQHYRVVCFIH